MGKYVNEPAKGETTRVNDYFVFSALAWRATPAMHTTRCTNPFRWLDESNVAQSHSNLAKRFPNDEYSIGTLLMSLDLRQCESSMKAFRWRIRARKKRQFDFPPLDFPSTNKRWFWRERVRRQAATHENSTVNTRFATRLVLFWNKTRDRRFV